MIVDFVFLNVMVFWGRVKIILLHPPVIVYLVPISINILYIHPTGLNDSRVCISPHRTIRDFNRRVMIVGVIEPIIHFRLVHQPDPSPREVRHMKSKVHRRILFRGLSDKWAAILKTVTNHACFVLSWLRVATKRFVVDEDWHSSRKGATECRQDATVGDGFVSVYN